MSDRVYFRGFDAKNDETFIVREVPNGVLAVANGAVKLDDAARATVRLEAVDQEPEKNRPLPLFVWPVLAATLKADNDSGKVSLEGRFRCLIPTLRGNGSAAKFEFAIERDSFAPAFVKFASFKIGPISVKDLSCRAGALQTKAPFVSQAPGVPSRAPYEPLLGFNAAFTSAVSIVWPWTLQFRAFQAILEDNTLKDKAHARLVIEVASRAPMATAKQRFTPSALSFDGSLWPSQSFSLESFHTAAFLQRLPAEKQWAKNKGSTTEWLVAVEVPQQPVLEWWNTVVVDPVIEAIDTVRGGRPFSALPTLSAAERPAPWRAWLTAVDLSSKTSIDSDDVKAIVARSEATAGFLSVVPRLLTPDFPLEAADGKLQNKPALTASFRGVVLHSSTSLEATVTPEHRRLVPELTDGSTDVAAYAVAFLFSALKSGAGAPVQLTRMGALDLQLPAARPLSESPATKWFDADHQDERLTGIATLSVRGNVFQVGDIVNRLVTFSLPVISVRPGAQDDVEGSEFQESTSINSAALGRQADEDRLPLILDLPPQKTAEGATADSPALDALYRIQFSESTERGHSQSAFAELFRAHPSPDGRTQTRAVVLDPEPFSIFLVESALDLSAAELETSTAIANWSNRGNDVAWEIRSNDDGFALMAPAQGIGEAMHRRAEDGDILAGKPIDFRFTPATRLRMRSTDTRQRFVEAPWNLRRTIGRRGFFAGTPIARVDFELFYGMAGRLTARGLRLAEIGARAGALPLPLPAAPPWTPTKDETDVYDAFSTRRWLPLLRGLKTRLGVFEVWSPAHETQHAAGAVPPLVLDHEDGLAFHLRKTASLRHPIPGTDPSKLAPFTPDGLAGGWSWGFESRNILGAVLRNPESTAASLTGFLISALGGWGQQKASYDRGLTTIHAKVEMGRTSTVNIERLGRIGVFWSKAKHVIVYSRSVVASRQFYLEQVPLVGNPILRKVDEYVELLEEERAFPDSNVPPQSRGFVLGVRFAGGKPPRIRVNSKWGQDVGTIGWKVPLWSRGAAPEDVYPKPAIFALTSGSAREDRIPIAIDDPEKLFFYTSTDPTESADSNSWLPVQSVDFDAVTSAEVKVPDRATNVGGDPKNFGPNVPDLLVCPALGRFTFALEPAPAAANVVVDRAAEVVRAVPRSITLMRGAVVDDTLKGPSQDSGRALAQLRAHLTNAFAPVLQPSGAQSVAEQVQEFKARLATLQSEFNRVSQSITETALCDALQARVERQFTTFGAEVRLQIVSALQQFVASYREKALALVAKNLPIDELRAKLREELVRIASEAGGARDQIRNARGTAGEIFGKLAALSDTLTGAAYDAAGLVNDAAAAVASLPDWSTGSQAIARETLKKLSQRWEPFVLRGPIDFAIGEVVRAWLGEQTDLVSHALAQGRTDARTELDTLIADLKASQGELVAALHALADATAGFFELAVGLIDDKWTDALEPLVETELEAPLDALVARLDEMIGALDAVDEQKFRTAFDAVIDGYFATLDDALKSAVSQAATTFGASAKNLCHELVPSLKQVAAMVGDLLDAGSLGFLDGVTALSDDLRRRVEQALSRMAQGLAEFVGRAQISLPQFPTGNPLRATDDVFRLLRAFGDVPKLPNLDFGLPQIGYYFSQPAIDLPTLPAIDLTPVAAVANKVLRGLNGIDLHVPAGKLLDRLVPPDLGDFDLSKLFPSLAGIKFDRLFAGERAPGSATNGIRITHGVSPETRTGWLQADVDVPFDRDATVFDLCGVKLTLARGRFRGTSRITATPGEPPRQVASGSISGDWQLEAGGMPIADLTECTLFFDNGGRIRFEITPSQVTLRPPLDFLSRILEPFTSGDGFSIVVTPTGIRTILILPIPNVQAGTFGIANLSLGFLFELLIVPEFTIRTALLVARRERPFTLTVFVLGGAGSLELGVTYIPRLGTYRTDLSIAIYASASLAIAIGPIAGGIYAYFGITVTYSATSDGSSALFFGLRIMFVGEVCLLGFLSVGLTLGLEALYSGNNLIGRGFVSFSIKIGPFLTIEVQSAIEYSFGSGQSTTSSQKKIGGAAAGYVDMF